MSQGLLPLFGIFIVLATMLAYWRIILAVMIVLALSFSAFGVLQVVNVIGGLR